MSNETYGESLVPTDAAEAAKQEEEGAIVLLSTAQSLVIQSAGEYEQAVKFRDMAKKREREIEARRVAITGPINAGLKAVNDMFRPARETCKSAVAVVDDGCRGYLREVQRRQQEEVRRAQAERQKQLLEDAERAAKVAEAEGDAAKADRIIEAAFLPEQAPRPVAIATEAAPKVAGHSVRTTWDYRVTDPTIVPREYLMLNDKMLAAKARTEKANAHVPGIEFFEDFNFATSR